VHGRRIEYRVTDSPEKLTFGVINLVNALNYYDQFSAEYKLMDADAIIDFKKHLFSKAI